MSDTASDAGSEKELDLSNVRPDRSTCKRAITAVMALRTSVEWKLAPIRCGHDRPLMHGTDQASFFLQSRTYSRSSKQRPTSSIVRLHPSHSSHQRAHMTCVCEFIMLAPAHTL